MWKTMEVSSFKTGVVRFSLRELVERYMFPDRRYRASGKLLVAVEKELHRIADTRIHSDRWYDKRLGMHTEIDAAIIDYVQVIKKGGRNSPRVIEIKWGTKLMESIQAKYTRGLDIKTWIQIDHPTDEVLYRWLDRQLYDKPVEEVSSCQRFARFKLGMHGERVERGGRTASSYIAGRLGESIGRLSGIGFAVRMSIDDGKDDFSLRFERIQSPVNEVVITDPPGDLVREFRRFCHGICGDIKRIKVNDVDRQRAAEWVRAYRYEQAAWMVRRCSELHNSGAQAKRPLYSFAGLSFYEGVAAGDYERWKEREAGQLRLAFQERRKELWDKYCEMMLRRADDSLTEAEKVELEAKARADVSTQHKNLRFSESIIEILIDSVLRTAMLERVSMLTEKEFMGYETYERLREALVLRHGTDLLVDQTQAVAPKEHGTLEA
jgi:hypothetical protein